MNLRLTRTILAGAALAGALSGCAGFAVSENPCADANRAVSFDTLFENSVRGTYEQCLNDLRTDAVSALER